MTRPPRMTAGDYAFLTALRNRDHGLGVAFPMRHPKVVRAWSRYWIMPTPCLSTRSPTRTRFRITDIGKDSMRAHEAERSFLAGIPPCLLSRA